MHTEWETRAFVFHSETENTYLLLYTLCQGQVIQGVSRLLDITAVGDFLGLCDQNVHINMCPISDGYGFMGIY